MKRKTIAFWALSFCCAVIALWTLAYADGPDVAAMGEGLHGKYSYEDFSKPEYCAQCHVDIARQWEQSWMAKAYDSPWDEIEYFELAVEHGKRNPKFAPVADGCNGCHAPISFMAGDTPPPRPAENSRANESVSCEVCHTISAIDESKLYNFSFFASPGRVKYGARGGESSPVHDLARTDFHDSAKLCANCHNEQSPWGIYVKGTYNEWLEGPYAEQGVQCQTCHMPSAPGQRALTSAAKQDDMRQHLFLGGHVSSKVAGAIEVMIHPDDTEYELGDTVVFSAHLFNGKAGHKIPTGSVEDRMLYLVVEAQDAEGKKWTLAVDRKGFNGEEYTIAGAERAYRDFREMMDLPADWDGLPRDGAVPAGSRIFRMPYFTESGEMTICQWNTASFGADYRIGPRENKIETYTWDIPDEAAEGELRIHAALYYQLLVDSVADFLEVPDTYKQAQLVSEYETSITIFD